MINMKKIMTYLAPVILSCTFPVVAHASAPAQRIWGSDRYETSLNTSLEGWTNSKYAIIVNGENFPDALSAAPLSKKYNAPIILTPKDSLSNSVEKELKRLKVEQVFIAGGIGVVSESVEKELNSIGIMTTRLAGINRYATSAKISEELGNSDKVVITTGDDFTDAVSIAPIAASKGMPILLVSKNYIDDSTKAYLSGKNISKAYVLGDSNIISDAVASQIPNVERITGNDKYERNVNVINKFTDSIDFSRLYVANGEAFPDALSGSAIAAKTSSAILLTNLNPGSSTKNFISSNISKFKEIDILGGTGVIPSSTLSQLGDINEIKYMSDVIQPYYSEGSVTCSSVFEMPVAGRKYTKGYQTQTQYKGDGLVAFNLGGQYKSISGLISLGDNGQSNDYSVTALGDGKVINTYTLKKGSLPQNMNLDVTGISKLELKLKCLGDVDYYSYIDIVNPTLDGALLPSVSTIRDSSDNSSLNMSDVIQPYYSEGGVTCSSVFEMLVAGQKYTKGYQTQTQYKGDGLVAFNLGGQYKSISGLISLGDNAQSNDYSVTVLGDGKVMNTYTLKKGSLPQNMNLDVAGISKLELKLKCLGDVDYYSYIDIVNPIIK